MRRLLVFAIVAAFSFAIGAGVEQRRHPVEAPAAPVAAAPSAAPAPSKTPVNYADEPLWAYGVVTVPKATDPADPVPPPGRRLRPNEDPAEQTKLRTVAGSTATYSVMDVRDSGHVIDWFPGDHPPMPEVIKRGPVGMGEVTRGCGSCHLPNGKGRPENAPVAGHTPAYFLRQMQDFRNGLRYSAEPRKSNTPIMITIAASLTDEELLTAMKYFTAIKYDRPWIRVVESPMAPKVKAVNQLFVAVSKDLTEPIAGRIVETPEDEQQSEYVRNPHSGFVAYVPPGSLATGKVLAETGGTRIDGTQVISGRATACITCHGVDLRGVEDVPAIAGRSASYIARQLWDIQQGTRNGSGVALMKAAIAKLTPDDIVALSAYVASRPPR